MPPPVTSTDRPSSAPAAKISEVVPGALIGYSYRVRLPAGTSVDTWKTALKAAFPDAGWRLRDFSNAAPTLQRLLDRVGR